MIRKRKHKNQYSGPNEWILETYEYTGEDPRIEYVLIWDPNLMDESIFITLNVDNIEDARKARDIFTQYTFEVG